MITEDYVNFELAKLLKEKGFDVNAINSWHIVPSETCNFEELEKIVCGDINEPEYSEDYYPMITTQIAMKWLEEVHHILVVPDYIYECTNTSWVYKIFRLGENGKPEKVAVKGVSYDENNNPTEHIVGYRDYKVSYKDYATREEAEEEGIRYVLENLI